jgi:hypothetical protein
MELREIVAVTGVPGLKKLVANRNDGLVLSDLNGENKKFYSSRQHMFSPLENISIYTETDMAALGEVLWKMKEQLESTPPVDPNTSNDELRNYLGKIQPDFDRDRVNVSDIKKLIKWFHILSETDVIKKPEYGQENE